MNITVSELNTFQLCPQLWYYQYVLGRVPAVEPVAFTGGKLWHSFVEGIRTGAIDSIADLKLTAENAIAEHWAAGRERQANELSNTWDILQQVAPFYGDQHAGETVAVETALRAKLGNIDGEEIWIEGIPDRVKRSHGQLSHVQTRTLSDGTPLVPYFRAAARNMHELIYAWLMREHYREPVAGSEMQVLVKLKLWSDRKCKRFDTKWHQERSRPTCDDCGYSEDGRVRTQLHTPEEAMVHAVIPIDPWQVQGALDDAFRLAGAMLKIRRGTESPVQNRAADLGRYGNSLCPFFDVCEGTAGVEDDTLFKDRESRYEDVGMVGIEERIAEAESL